MKEKLRALKTQKTKLLNKECETLEQFEEVQERLNQIELEMKLTKGKINMKKWRINWKKVRRNLFIILNLVIFGMLIHKISVNGISWISTIGYFN